MALVSCFRTEALSTKIGLSIGAVTVCCSLCDELADFGRSENDRQLFEQKTSQHWVDGEFNQFGPCDIVDK